MNLSKILIPSIVVTGLAVSAWLYQGAHAHDEHGHEGHGHEGHGHEAAEESVVKGPNRGRLLADGDFTLELAIFEAGVPPEFRAWFTKAGKAVAPADVKLSVTLMRPGNIEDRFVFASEGEYLRGDHEVVEPHSFNYVIVAEHAGVAHKWAFEAPEMQTVIPAAAAEKAGVKVEKAGPAELEESIEVYGRIALDQDGVRRATSRFPGVVLEARKSLGDKVVAGEVVARVENSHTLVSAEVKAPGAGLIIARSGAVGETVAEGTPLYTIASLEKVWVELEVPRKDLARVKTGQSVVLKADDGTEVAKGTIVSISPLLSADTQLAIARVVIPNPDGGWRPGGFVKGAIAVSSSRASVTVKSSAIQTLFDFTVVFSQHGDVYQARPLELGRRSGDRVEVLKGLAEGETYVSEGSFLIKSDIGKSSASHDH
jgi:cobalt-zinc-cadmium efflux system membrane fusion protein